MSDLSIEIPFVRFNDTRTTSYSSIGRTAAESLPAAPSECKNWRIRNRKRGNGSTMTPVDKIKNLVDQGIEKAEPLVDQALEKVESLAERAKERAESLGDQTREKAEPLVDKARERAEPLLERVTDSSGKDSTP